MTFTLKKKEAGREQDLAGHPAKPPHLVVKAGHKAHRQEPRVNLGVHAELPFGLGPQQVVGFVHRDAYAENKSKTKACNPLQLCFIFGEGKKRFDFTDGRKGRQVGAVERLELRNHPQSGLARVSSPLPFSGAYMATQLLYLEPMRVHFCGAAPAQQAVLKKNGDLAHGVP